MSLRYNSMVHFGGRSAGKPHLTYWVAFHEAIGIIPLADASNAMQQGKLQYVCDHLSAASFEWQI